MKRLSLLFLLLAVPGWALRTNLGVQSNIDTIFVQKDSGDVDVVFSVGTTTRSGTSATVFSVQWTNGAVGNEAGRAAGDLRWETDNEDSAFVVDAGGDSVKIGVTLNARGALHLSALRDTVGAIITDSTSSVDSSSINAITSTTQTLFSDGDSAHPAITNLGDLNTGIYFPTADQVAVTNGGVRTLLVSGDDITVRDDINVGDDVLLPATGVVNWGAGDVTVTGGTGTLTLAGASSGYQFNDGNVGIGDATTITLGLGIEKASADVGMRVERTGDVASVGQYFIDSNGWVNIYAVTSGKNIGLITEGAGAVNVNSLGASASVSTDGSKNLTTASDSSWKQDQGEIDHATPILMGLRPRYWTWKKDMNGLLTNPARRDVWSSTRAEAWSRVTGSDSSTALAAVALKDRPALRAKVGRVSVLDEQPWIAGFFSQEVYAVFPEGSPGGPNLDSQGNEHWGLNTTAIIALTARALQEQVGRTDSLSAVVARQDSLIADASFGGVSIGQVVAGLVAAVAGLTAWITTLKKQINALEERIAKLEGVAPTPPNPEA